MRDNVTWIVDLDAAANQASDVGERVRQWLTDCGIDYPGRHLMRDAVTTMAAVIPSRLQTARRGAHRTPICPAKAIA